MAMPAYGGASTVPGEGTNRPTLAFDNSQARFIDGTPDASNGTVRGATGTTPWTLYEFELPVDKTASNINFGVLFTGTGTAWVDLMKVELDGEPYSNPQVRFRLRIPHGEGLLHRLRWQGRLHDYKVGIDDTTSYSGHQSLKMQYVGDGAAQKVSSLFSSSPWIKRAIRSKIGNFTRVSPRIDQSR